jgi:hypothetical protein
VGQALVSKLLRHQQLSSSFGGSPNHRRAAQFETGANIIVEIKRMNRVRVVNVDRSVAQNRVHVRERRRASGAVPATFTRG